MYNQNNLEEENQKLQNDLIKLKEREAKSNALLEEYESSIKKLSDRLSKLLTS